MRSEHERHTEFLKQCLLYDESATRQEIEDGIIRLQRDVRCVRRAAWLMAVLNALTVAVLGYGIVLGDNFPYHTPQSVINMIFVLGVGSLICLVTFLSLGMMYRLKLDQRREECRQLVTHLLESRLGKPVTTPLPGQRANPAGNGNAQPDRAASAGIGSPGKIQSVVGN